jgi:serine/threonine protein kinase
MDGKAYTFSSDIWSIGMVVYEMATGHHPYNETQNFVELSEMIRTTPAPSLEGIKGLSPLIVNFVSRW